MLSTNIWNLFAISNPSFSKKFVNRSENLSFFLFFFFFFFFFFFSFFFQARIPNIRSYLKLYSSIDTEKLANFLKVSPSELRALLLSYKHKRWELFFFPSFFSILSVAARLNGLRALRFRARGRITSPE